MVFKKARRPDWFFTINSKLKDSYEYLKGPEWTPGQKAHFKACLIWILIAIIWTFTLRKTDLHRFQKKRLEFDDQASKNVKKEAPYRNLFSPNQRLVVLNH